MPEFQLQSEFQPAGDQPAAIAALVKGIHEGRKEQVLLGVTGSGKTFTMANVIQQLQRPALVLSHNKTLAAQLYSEFKEFFPHNAVSYFVSYYDYYQPEAYIPQRDIYIEKDASINEEIDRLRLQATSSLVSRRDVIVVASVSCIYGLGSPKDYLEMMLPLRVGDEIDRDEMLLKLIDIQYDRNDVSFQRGTVPRAGRRRRSVGRRTRNSPIASSCGGMRSKSCRSSTRSPDKKLAVLEDVYIYPAKHFVMPQERIDGGHCRRSKKSWTNDCGKLRRSGQTAGSATAGGPHAVRPGNDAGSRLLPRHRKLQPAVVRPTAGISRPIR